MMEEAVMRKDIEFKIEDGVTLRGWHYLPDSRQGKLPTIIMAHGFSAVKEMYLDRFAEVFAAAGLSSVVFDNRNFGASEGEPRQEIGPWRQLRDYRDAITYAETLASTDPNVLGSGDPATAEATCSSWERSIDESGASCRRCRWRVATTTPVDLFGPIILQSCRGCLSKTDGREWRESRQR
jgi:X-Pro dipeptidyl-peptidase (S15 family)